MVTPAPNNIMATKIDIKKLDIWFGDEQVLKGVEIGILEHEILSVIGPSNSGKTTFLRTLNRMNELNVNFKMNGSVRLDEKDVWDIDVEALRRRVGMVFALPLPLPLLLNQLHPLPLPLLPEPVLR